eukprot:TRINITY_DN1338_c3_g1_i1.p1 TRINITY_DN1338_c3_g1~~TRINITY_DN1338_c3_g1_i1.p1  ORF type:complete len:126 (-),score=74.24 TRINITY_DN1338_c3_g1_i1:20-397(-)
MNQPSSLRSMIVQDLLQTEDFGYPDEDEDDGVEDDEEDEEEEVEEEEEENEIDWEKMMDLESIKQEHARRLEKQKKKLQKQTTKELKKKKKKKEPTNQTLSFKHSAADAQRLSELLDSRNTGEHW